MLAQTAALRTLGADAVGMSTVLEAIQARALGMERDIGSLEPGKKAEKGKGDKGGKKGAQKPESVDEATWKKFQDASKAAQTDAAVVAAKAKASEAKTDEEKKAAGKAVMEATKAAILKADASLESVFKALEEARGKGKGKGDKKGEGKKPEAK